MPPNWHHRRSIVALESRFDSSALQSPSCIVIAVLRLIVDCWSVFKLSTMNDETYQQPEEERNSSTNAESGSSSSSSKSSREAFEDLGQSIRDAFKSGSRDARKTVEEALPKVKSEFSRGVHDLAYAVAYATSFGAALVDEITPDNVKEGFREGSQAGKRAAEDVVRNQKERAAREGTDPSTDEGEPVIV